MKTFPHALAAGLLCLASSFSPPIALAEDPPLSDLAGREPIIPDLAPRVTRSFETDAEPSTLSLRFATRRTRERRDYAGSLVLTLPTDFALAPAKAKEIVGHEGLDDREGVEVVGGDASAPPGPRRAFPRAERALPPLRPRDARAAVYAAQDAARVHAAMARVDGLASRARWSALLPRLRLRATRLVDESTSLSPTSYDPGRTTASGGASLWLEARTTWQLDRLVFASEEPRIERLRIAHRQRAKRIRLEVLELLHRWRAALLKVRDPALDSQACLEAELDADHAAASLDVMTDGWFSEWRARSGLPAPDCSWPEVPDEEAGAARSLDERRVVDLAARVPRQGRSGPNRVGHHVRGESAGQEPPK